MHLSHGLQALIDFGYQRNWKEAVIFYISYLVVIIVMGVSLSLLISTIVGVEGESENFMLGIKIGATVAVAGVLILGILVLAGKQLLRHKGYIMLVLLAGLLAIWGGSLLGLIPIAYLTTRSSDQSKNIGVK